MPNGGEGSIGGTIKVIVEGLGGGGGGEGEGPPTGGEGEDTAKTQRRATTTFGVLRKLAPMIGVGFGIFELIKHSKVLSSVSGAMFDILSAIVDVFLMPLMPIFIAIMNAIVPLIPVIQKISSDILTPIVDGITKIVTPIANIVLKIAELIGHIVEVKEIAKIIGATLALYVSSAVLSKIVGNLGIGALGKIGLGTALGAGLGIAAVQGILGPPKGAGGAVVTTGEAAGAALLLTRNPAIAAAVGAVAGIQQILAASFKGAALDMQRRSEELKILEQTQREMQEKGTIYGPEYLKTLEEIRHLRESTPFIPEVREQIEMGRLAPASTPTPSPQFAFPQPSPTPLPPITVNNEFNIDLSKVSDINALINEVSKNIAQSLETVLRRSR